MNLLLSDDYLLQDYPENITNTIRSGHATVLRFNRTGDHLASGRVDGTVVVWDLETMGVARKLRGHSKSITFLSWSHCGRYLLSTCQGWKAIMWDLQDGSRFREIRFRAPAYMAEIHPSNQCVSLVDRNSMAYALTVIAFASWLPYLRSNLSWLTLQNQLLLNRCYLQLPNDPMPTATPQ
jgi:WD40 repeat protein